MSIPFFNGARPTQPAPLGYYPSSNNSSINDGGVEALSALVGRDGPGEAQPLGIIANPGGGQVHPLGIVFDPGNHGGDVHPLGIIAHPIHTGGGGGELHPLGIIAQPLPSPIHRGPIYDPPAHNDPIRFTQPGHGQPTRGRSPFHGISFGGVFRGGSNSGLPQFVNLLTTLLKSLNLN